MSLINNQYFLTFDISRLTIFSPFIFELSRLTSHDYSPFTFHG